MKFPLHHSRRLWLCGGVGLALLLGIAWSSLWHWLPLLATSLDISEPLTHASVVFILPGSEETRPFVAAGLFKAGYADRVVVPGTRDNSDVHGGIELSTVETTRQILLKRGVPASQIVAIPASSDSTIGDATMLAQYFEQVGATDVIIVTNAYHSRRARWTFRHVLPQYRQHLRFYSAPNDFDAQTWWTSRKGRICVVSEWLKYLYYVLSYGRGWMWCLAAVLMSGTAWFTRRRYRNRGN